MTQQEPKGFKATYTGSKTKILDSLYGSITMVPGHSYPVSRRDVALHLDHHPLVEVEGLNTSSSSKDLEPSEESDGEDYSKHTVPQLKKLLDELGVEYSNDDLKEDLIGLVQEAQSE